MSTIQHIEVSLDGQRWRRAFMRVVDELPAKPDDRLLPEGFRWVKSGNGWTPAEDAAAC